MSAGNYFGNHIKIRHVTNPQSRWNLSAYDLEKDACSWMGTHVLFNGPGTIISTYPMFHQPIGMW